jgi:hypothetical protein
VEAGLRASTPQGEESGVAELLSAAAVHRLSEALRRPGRVRESAFDLLAADALITYACEAALDVEEGAAGLAEIARRLVREEGAS